VSTDSTDETDFSRAIRQVIEAGIAIVYQGVNGFNG